MKEGIYRSIGEMDLYITVTTRKASYAMVYFGKFTFWRSKKHYDEGDCEGAYTYEGVYLGCHKSNLEVEANEFIDKTLKRGEMVWPH